MSNHLEMAMIQAMMTLHARGWSQRRIARELGLHRETVARHLALTAKPATNPPPGSIGPVPDSPACPGPLSIAASVPEASSPAARSGPVSECESHRQIIQEKLRQGLTAQRIYQDLVGETGFAHSYDSVKRFVRRLCIREELPYRRMECAPGQEAQVDFGSGPALVGVDGKRRRTHVFRIVLSHSRKGYGEGVFHQSTEDFLACLENAFWEFGGVPRTVVIDNLRAAVNRPDWYDPEVNGRVEAFCVHYGTVILPTKPYMPRHKGKIERGIAYIKDNGLAGHRFSTLAQLNAHLQTWESTVADRRIHGTTRQQVGKVFDEVERRALLPLPAGRFPYFQESLRSVHRDGHVEVAKAYYSVPPEYAHRQVWARWDSRTVRIFNHRHEQIALHARREAGRFATDQAHIPSAKIWGVERGAEELLRRAGALGTHSAAWGQAMLQARGIAGVRVLLGLLSLAGRYPPGAIDRACQMAASHRSYRLRAIRELLVRGESSAVQEPLPLLESHELIRPPEEYGLVVREALRPWSRQTGTDSDQGAAPAVQAEPSRSNATEAGREERS